VLCGAAITKGREKEDETDKKSAVVPSRPKRGKVHCGQKREDDRARFKSFQRRAGGKPTYVPAGKKRGKGGEDKAWESNYSHEKEKKKPAAGNSKGRRSYGGEERSINYCPGRKGRQALHGKTEHL